MYKFSPNFNIFQTKFRVCSFLVLLFSPLARKKKEAKKRNFFGSLGWFELCEARLRTLS